MWVRLTTCNGWNLSAHGTLSPLYDSPITLYLSLHDESGADPGFDQGGGTPDRDRPKTAILGPQFCRILVLGPHFWWSGGGGPGPRAPPWIRP